ncbi:MAG TPA: acyl-CoA dehydrogenase family protein [Anaeromyxobacteraceae bacterium]|nr:acyl-CoA dehydrogenase family protein [Anaeromyxobacteraceae bacterium]
MIDKGSASFVQSLCLGRIEEEIILPYPAMKAEEKELLGQVLASVDQVLGAHQKDFRAWDVAGEMPPAFVDELKAFGLFGLVIPEAHGGMGFGSAAYSRVLQQIATHDGSVALTVGAHSSIGMRGLLLFGTDEQKRTWLPRLASGELIAAFCLTEPGAGSDAASVKTTARREGEGWVLNGEKLWITNGGIAGFYTVFAKTPSPGEGKAQMTAFIVPRDLPGVSTGPHEDKMGIRASNTTTVHFEDVKLGPEHVLGEVGKGFKAAMRILNAGRTGLGGGCVGGMKRLIALATKQAKERKQFGRAIAEFGLVKQKLGDMVVDAYAAEAVVGLVAGLADQGYGDYAVEAAISKIFATEALWRTADQALQIAGGNGYMRELPYERVVRDSRINRIFEGTNEILRLFVGLTGANVVGDQLKELVHGMKGVLADPIKGFGVLSDYALKHASIRTGLVGERRSFTRLHPALAEIAEGYEGLTRELAWVVDRELRRHGKAIVEKQLVVRRIADILVDLFVAAAILSRVTAALEAKGEAGAAREVEIARVFGREARGRIRGNLRRVDSNDDDLVAALADDALDREGFRWDLV